MRALILALVVLCAYTPLAYGESDSNDTSFTQEYDKKIKSLNDYTVTFVDANSKPSKVTAVKSNGFEVTLIHVKKKSKT